MSRSNAPSDTVAIGEKIAFFILSAFCIGLISVAIIESSDSSILFKRLLEVDYRLPLSMVVFAGAGILGSLIWVFEKTHPNSGWFSLRRDDLPSPTVQRFYRFATAACLLALGILVMHSFGPPVDRKMTDFFHEGEILAGWAIINNSADVPILIHGPGRNLLPAALASLFAQPGQEIAFMRFVTGIGRMITVLMVATATYAFAFALLDGLASASRRHMSSFMVSLAAVVVAVLAAHVTNRHVLFLMALALAVGIIHTADRKRRQAHFLSAWLGAVCALSPIYVYSTFLEAAAIAVIAAGIQLVHHGLSTVRLIGTALGGFAACVALVFALGGGDLYGNAVRDILWWGIDGRGIWSLPLTGRRAMLDSAVIIGTIALIGYLALRKTRSDDRAERKRGALLFLLAAAVAVATRDMLDRSDSAHTGFTLLTAAIGLGSLAARPALTLAQRWPRLLAAGVASAALALGTVTLAVGDGRRPALSSLNTPDELILPDAIKMFAKRYEAELAGADCLLVLTNEGALNYATNLPPCGKFFYPIYASVPAGDIALAEWLQTNPQQIVVVETDFWSDNIDNEPMRIRLPAVWALIEATMKSMERTGGRLVAVRQ